MTVCRLCAEEERLELPSSVLETNVLPLNYSSMSKSTLLSTEVIIVGLFLGVKHFRTKSAQKSKCMAS